MREKIASEVTSTVIYAIGTARDVAMVTVLKEKRRKLARWKGVVYVPGEDGKRRVDRDEQLMIVVSVAQPDDPSQTIKGRTD